MRWLWFLPLLCASCANLEKNQGYIVDEFNVQLVEQANQIVDKTLWHRILVVHHVYKDKKHISYYCVFKDIDGHLHAYDKTGSLTIVDVSGLAILVADQLRKNVTDAYYK